MDRHAAVFLALWAGFGLATAAAAHAVFAMTVFPVLDQVERDYGGLMHYTWHKEMIMWAVPIAGGYGLAGISFRRLAGRLGRGRDPGDALFTRGTGHVA